MKRLIFILLICIVNLPGTIRAQSDLDSLLLDEDIDFSILSEDSLLLDELEGLSIFTLLDSILNGDYKKSQLALRIGFTSDVVNAGRDLGTDQKGLTPGVSYYHKSGLFASAIGYWNSQFSPKYNFTVLSAGYFGVLKNKLIYSGSYEKTFYHETNEESDIASTSISNSFTNNIGLGLSYDFKHLYSSVDYSFLFGNEVTHRLRWGITGYLKKKNFLFFDYILFTPNFSLLFGKEDIVLATFNLREQLQQSDEAEIFRDLAALGYTRQSFQTLSPRDKESALRQAVAPEASVFGLMNYGFSIPLSFRKGPWSYTMSYNYNIPVELPGEELSLSSSGYLGLSLTYYISL